MDSEDTDQEIKVEFEDGENMDNLWYHESDTSEDIPDPNLEEKSLFQKWNSLPVELRKDHFQEGLLYLMTLDQACKEPMLVMIILSGEFT